MTGSISQEQTGGGDCGILALSSPVYFPNHPGAPSPAPLSPPPFHVLSPHDKNRHLDDNDDI